MLYAIYFLSPPVADDIFAISFSPLLLMPIAAAGYAARCHFTLLLLQLD